MTARGFTTKTKLTPKEKIQVVHAHLILGVDQHLLVGMFGVNQGRINKAIADVKKAVEWPVEEENDLFDTDGQ